MSAPLGSQATPPPKRDLSSAFTPGLRVPPRQRPTPTPDPATHADAPAAPATTGNSPEATSKPAGRRGRPRKAASATADQTLTANRVVYVPNDLRDTLAMTCARSHLTRTQVVLEAITATHTRLADLVADDLRPQVIAGDLWDEVVYPSRARQPAKRQVFIKPTLQQLATIDGLVDKTGARDRSHLVVVALRAHLHTGA